jgi:hypothetical protein
MPETEAGFCSVQIRRRADVRDTSDLCYLPTLHCFVEKLCFSSFFGVWWQLISLSDGPLTASRITRHALRTLT